MNYINKIDCFVYGIMVCLVVFVIVSTLRKFCYRKGGVRLESHGYE